ncbi:rRNA small subunit methyltransferase, glucose inhibited division protein GidB [Liberibacter crescens BT-1]|uniref:Ribosomal RNA small subunit methyltransferase G n=1 Tax=Liberibacter crescens (strain BT-1) TaxID=1215343 RepID=L0ET48_LIBCB|nr:16S rRNA (guanine(527)-N(7))-methyltransferase RsmG [Liberibacter crescens]AGA63995.1 rRNA small subunit methyltransferase, glucose inhibited division protein GidB [Liberibacter crescens BT-1]AMC12307.1 16S rRNA methyltransferase [Liberibacter crescens]
MKDFKVLLDNFYVSRETQERLQHFYFLFLKWSATINLVSSSDRKDLWVRHIQDSLQVFYLHPIPSVWLDLGSGGGFPGIMVAIQLAELKDGWVNLIESNHKKASFLRIALQETGARGTVYPLLIQKAPEFIQKCDVISARALTSFECLLEYSFPWLKENNNCKAFFYKGCSYKNEVNKACNHWTFSLIEHKSAIECSSVILEVTNLKRK